jgi:hypothetical protein
MATYVPAKRATELIFYMGLVSQSTGQFQANPTLAAGDVKVSKDGGALANLSTLPAVTPAGSKMVKVTLSGTEMTADNVTLVFSDAAGAEWDDCIVNIQTAARQIDDLATPTNITAGTITTATNVTTVNGLAANVITAASIATGAIDADAIADNAIDAGAIAADAITAAKIADGAIDAATFAAGAITATVIATGAIDADAIAADAVTEIQSGLATSAALATVQADTDNIQTRLPAALSGDGFMKADLKSIDDELTTGNNATLNLKMLNIINSTGNAFVAQSTSGIGIGAFIEGPGAGVIINSTAGDGLDIDGDGYGAYIHSRSASSTALYIDGVNYGIEVYGGSDAIHAESLTDGHGIGAVGAGTGKSIAAPQDIALPSGDLDDQIQAIDNFIDTEVTAIKTKTDSLTFTTAGQVDANVQSVNDTELTGDGSGTPWGPA